ncbi:hypothetical protein [Pseudomonas sp. Irchel 3H9]|uniref:hypothetical protein n=1 Tax=Pseudomonas sp. Irchel 3H9 TaxID=2009043 RepID=UPI00117BCCED|nr:hypothetical protein [Pseudomonas sp. Irchel 3H9]
MKPIIAALPFFLLTGCTSPSFNPSHQTTAPTPKTILYRYTMPADAIVAAHTLVSHDLKDPDSVRFRDAFVITSDANGENRNRSKDSWCVEVNAKNSYGGYVGYTWALVPAGSKTVIMGGSATGIMATQICASAIYPPA